MSKFITKSRSIAILSVLLVGAFLGTAFGSAMSVEAATVPTNSAPSGLTAVNANYIIYIDASGYTCAKNVATSAIDFRDTNSRTVIQKAIDKTSVGTIWIQSGTYIISTAIYTCKTSITGDGNGTILRASSALSMGIIMVTGDYYKVDGTRAMPSGGRPTGITISNLQIDGNKAGRVLRGIGFINTLNSNIYGVYVHDLTAGQGFYMANSQYCTIKNSQAHNIGDDADMHYGAGIAFGEASVTKVACAYITIDKCRISKCSMASIDLEPANNITITRCVFLEAATWNGRANPVIGLYVIGGYDKPNNNIVVSGNTMYGAFGEFIILTPSHYSVVSNNVITYTGGTVVSIYAKGSHDSKIIGNVISTVSKNAITMIDCNSFTVSNNKVTDSTNSKGDYGIWFQSMSGHCYYNVIKGNTVTGFGYGITATSGISHLIVTGNTFSSCTVGTFLKGTDIIKTPNVLNGAAQW